MYMDPKLLGGPATFELCHIVVSSDKEDERSWEKNNKHVAIAYNWLGAPQRGFIQFVWDMLSL